MALLCLCGVAVAEELRDPFTFGGRTTAQQQAEPTLTGILWDATRPLAMVGDEMLAAGDRLGDCQVMEIRREGARIRCGQRETLVLPGDPLPH